MIDAQMIALTATNALGSMPPYPIIRTCDSFSIIFGVVPDATSAWNPDSAPQAIVMKTNGNSEPAKTGPVPSRAKSVTASFSSIGRAIRSPTASSAIVPIFMNVDR